MESLQVEDQDDQRCAEEGATHQIIHRFQNVQTNHTKDGCGKNIIKHAKRCWNPCVSEVNAYKCEKILHLI